MGFITNCVVVITAMFCMVGCSSSHKYRSKERTVLIIIDSYVRQKTCHMSTIIGR
jgi:uncharacterized protein YcfL